MKMDKKKGLMSIRLVNIMLPISLAVAFASGILLQIFQDVPAFLILHKLSAVVLVVGVIVHMIQHRGKRGSKGDE